MTTSRNYIYIANTYMDDVMSGRRQENKWIIKAVERQLNDLKREGSEGFPFYFDEQAAARVCRFIETLPHVKGDLAQQNITLEPWQVWILTTVFGWLHMDGKHRRFRNAYVEVARGNGKSAFTEPDVGDARRDGRLLPLRGVGLWPEPKERKRKENFCFSGVGVGKTIHRKDARPSTRPSDTRVQFKKSRGATHATA